MNSFEGSFLGKHDRIDASTILECGVCWFVYDPREGDPIWQIPAGTSFSDLPAHWRCPHCDTPREQFMVVGQHGSGHHAKPKLTTLRRSDSLREQLLAAYEAVRERMERLPVYRGDLPLGVLGPRRCDAGLVSLVYTPWCMNIVLRADSAPSLGEGSERWMALPSGSYPFVRGHLDDVGVIENCSLFSPMDEFEDAAAVEAVAREAFRAIFESADAGDTEAAREAPADPSRRRFLSAGAAAP
ncbi:MAG: [NiFe]-hydrogenase assembly chaperone HybE [Pseudomonadota bacterium]